MKKILILLVSAALFSLNTYGQNQKGKGQKKQKTKQSSGATSSSEYGNTLNIGVGFGYFNGIPVIVNYEFDIADQITLAPFVGFASGSYGIYGTYSSFQFGAKGSYYFDELLNAGAPWDFWAGLSLGYVSVTYQDKSSWGPGIKSSKFGSGLLLGLQIGAEYHISNKVGAFLELGAGYAPGVLGVSIKF
jgi:hypothetical protein